MPDFYTFPDHEVIDALRDSRVDLKEPFSQSRWLNEIKPISGVTKMAKDLHWALIHGRDLTEVTDEELNVLRGIERRLEALQKKDLELRWKQDLILRCLHPDGCYRGYLDKQVIIEAYGIIPVDPVEGIRGIRIGWPSDKLDELYEFLKKKVEGLHYKHRSLY